MNLTKNANRITYAAFLLISSILPVPIWMLQTRLLAHSHSGQASVLFSFEAVCFAAALFAIGLIEVRRRRIAALVNAVPLILLLLTSFILLLVWNHHCYHASWDYGCYEDHAKIYVDSHFVDPGAHGNLYPPTMFQAQATCFLAIKRLLSILHSNPDEKFIWNGVFYVYQSIQFGLLLLAEWLSFRFLTSLKLSQAKAALITLLVLSINAPITSDLFMHQTNFWVLDSSLLAVIFAVSAPLVAAIALAVGTHVKLYPAILLLPLTFLRSYRVVALSVLAMVTIVLIGTRAGTDPSPWTNYLTSLTEFKSSMTMNSEVLNSNSLFACVRSFSLAISGLLGCAPITDSAALLVSRILGLLAMTVFVLRIWRRSSAYRNYCRDNADRAATEWWLKLTLYANCIDSLALALLISPRVFDYQYVALIPLVLFVVATRANQNPIKTIIGCALLLLPAPQSLCLYPIVNYHCLWGIVLLSSLVRVDIPRSGARSSLLAPDTVPMEKPRELVH